MKNTENREKFPALGRRLRQVRVALGFSTQAAFAKELGNFTLNRMSRAERGENLIPGEMLIALAKRGINVNWILTGEGPMWLASVVRLKEPVSHAELREILKEMARLSQRVAGLSDLAVPLTAEQRKFLESRQAAMPSDAEKTE